MAGFSPPAPAPTALVDWPAAFGTRFTILVDTEEEFDWRADFARDAHATTAVAAIPAAHARFADRGVPLVYLVDYPIATDPDAVAVLREVLADGRSAIGTQLHPWVNPPFGETLTAANSYVGNLPEALEAAKLDALTDAITTAFGAAPIIYRAGRYGIGPNSWRLLAERGYRIDTSVRAHYDYRDDGGPDFGAIGPQAFRCGPNGALIELPLTTVFTGAMRGRGEPLYRALGRFPRGRGLAARTSLLSRVSLTPEGMPIADAMEAVRVAVGEGARLLNFSFHSPSLVPGHTPYVRDAADLARFHGWWDQMLDLLARLGVRPTTLAELIAAA